MADPRDDRVSSAYRGMPGDGPAPALDEAIRAAARRAVGSRPGGARRWQIPVSIAAVLALAVGISLHVDREKPVVVDGTPVSSGSAEYPVLRQEPAEESPTGPAKPAAVPAAALQEALLAKEVAPVPAKESAPVPAKESAPPPAKGAAPMPAKESPRAPEAKRFAPDPPRAQPSAAASPSAPASMPAAPAAIAPAPAAAPPLPAAVAPSPARSPATLAEPAAPAGSAFSVDNVRTAPQAGARAKSEAARDAATQEKPQADAPERRLERIAELRAQGRHDDADRALAEFRRAYPAYRISEEWQKKVERR